MARRKPSTRGPRRQTHWEDAGTNLCIGFTSSGTPPGTAIHNTMLGTGTSPLMQTLIRLVGDIDVFINSDDTDFLPSTGTAQRHWHVINMGIQIVNRENAGSGDPRHPGIEDDREGGEWLWTRSITFGWHTYADDTTATLNNWFVPMWNVGGYNPHLDVKVKRKLDHQQDDIVFSIAGENCLDSTNMNFSCTLNARALIMDP